VRLCRNSFAKEMDARVKPAHDNLIGISTVENALASASLARLMLYALPAKCSGFADARGVWEGISAMPSASLTACS
jgi:hypothetical protein